MEVQKQKKGRGEVVGGKKEKTQQQTKRRMLGRNGGG
jgi:hypothetical protein